MPPRGCQMIVQLNMCFNLYQFIYYDQTRRYLFASCQFPIKEVLLIESKFSYGCMFKALNILIFFKFLSHSKSLISEAFKSIMIIAVLVALLVNSAFSMPYGTPGSPLKSVKALYSQGNAAQHFNSRENQAYLWNDPIGMEKNWGHDPNRMKNSMGQQNGKARKPHKFEDTISSPDLQEMTEAHERTKVNFDVANTSNEKEVNGCCCILLEKQKFSFLDC
ncbi:hypothetical protein Mgra_00008518 [Meloidogyne graminicola]|uniref:Uncharacterized protein n=1 Tax=Meloidogyne graminicola TaxID=189291 RepID=A0A8S9ZFL9_9BILA|nr:hypothetical protein Mgra_00008518 [Meloidogyne graminicola]